MGKKKQKQKSQIKVENVKSDTLMVIDDERITKIIVNALTEYDKQKQEAVELKDRQRRENYQKRLGVKNNKYSVLAILKVLCFPKKYARGVDAGTSFVKMALSALYKLIEYSIVLIASLLIWSIIKQLVIPNVVHMKWYDLALNGIWGVALLIFSRVFRIASIEVDEIRDNNYLFGLFAALTSIVSIIVAIVALLK